MTRGPEPSDEHLAALAAAGEREAFATLVERYKDPMVSYLTRLSGDRARAEDLAQETFIRLHRGLPAYRERGAFRGYLFRIATNLARSQARRDRRWRLIAPLLAPNSRPAAEEPAQESRLLAAERQRRLAAEVAALPPRYRIPLVLHEIEGWSCAEIADLVGCREGTVKSRVFRAKERLRRGLASGERESDAEPARDRAAAEEERA